MNQFATSNIGAATFSTTTLSITTLSITTLHTIEKTQHSALQIHAECCVLLVMLSVTMLNFVALSVVMQSVVGVNVGAPPQYLSLTGLI